MGEIKNYMKIYKENKGKLKLEKKVGLQGKDSKEDCDFVVQVVYEMMILVYDKCEEITKDDKKRVKLAKNICTHFFGNMIFKMTDHRKEEAFYNNAVEGLEALKNFFNHALENYNHEDFKRETLQ